MSLAEALRAGDLQIFGRLYDEYAARLYAYCHVMAGEHAGDAVRGAFISAAHNPSALPVDDAAVPVWLFGLARDECTRRAPGTAPGGEPSAAPLARAFARLRPEHREALALTVTLDPDDLPRVLGVAPDTADLLLHMSRRRLEQAVLAVVDGGARPDDDLLTALGTGRLHRLLAGMAAEPPEVLRERVLAACAEAQRAAGGALIFDDNGLPIPVEELFGPAEAVTLMQPALDAATLETLAAARAPGRPAAPVGAAVSGRPHRRPARPRRHGTRVEMFALAACVAAAVSAVVLWPGGDHPGGASNVDRRTVLDHGSPSAHSETTTVGSTPLYPEPGRGTQVTAPARTGAPASSATPPATAAPTGSPPAVRPLHARPTTGAGDSGSSATPAPTPTPTLTPASPAPSVSLPAAGAATEETTGTGTSPTPSTS